MENILREYEVRLLDGEGRLTLVVPVIAGTQAEADVLAAKLAAGEKAAGFVVKPQKNSRGYRAQKLPPAAV
jgi:hypothetical protein